MPSRHISPQSFDDILSDLGDDPAIPDPHGIRKSRGPSRPMPANEPEAKAASFPLKTAPFQNLKNSPIFGCGLVLLLGFGGLVLAFEHFKTQTKDEILALEGQISGLKKNFDLASTDWQEDKEDFYALLDEIEVSIHSKVIKAPAITPQNKPQAIPHEALLRRWRYLGLSKMDGLEQAFFHTGKASLSVLKEGLALGEWRLTNAQKESATFTHMNGKTITLQSIQSE